MGLQVPLAGLKQGKTLLEHTVSTENGVSLAGKRLAPALRLTQVCHGVAYRFFKVTL